MNLKTHKDRIQEITPKLEGIHERQEAILLSISRGDEEWTTELRDEYDELNEDYEKQAAEQKTLAAEVKAFETRNSGKPLSLTQQHGLSSMHTTTVLPTSQGASYQAMFGGGGVYHSSSITSTGGFENVEEFLATVHSGLNDDRLLNGMAAGFHETGSGGFLVPTEFEAQILDSALESEIVRPRAKVEPMASDTKTIAGFDASTASGGTLFGGFTSHWESEGDSLTEEIPKVRKIELKAKKLSLYSRASNEIVADAGSLTSTLLQTLIEAASWHLDFAFLNGGGAGEPLGLLNDPALIVTAKTVGQDAATITYANLAAMFARIHPGSIDNAVWICNSSTIPQLLQLFATDGTTSTFAPVLTESGGEFRMLTKPVLFTEKIPALGSEGDIILADLSQYSVGLRQGLVVEQSQHAAFSTDETMFRLIGRFDGQGRWKSSYQPYAGSTLSWVTTLAVRA